MSDQNNDIVAELERRWPGKLSDDEMLDLAPRLEQFKFQDVLGALEMHKARSKFKPTWAELLAGLKIITSSNAAAEPRPSRAEPAFPEMLSARFGEPAGVAVLLHFRKVWTKYAMDAVDRRTETRPGPVLDFALRQFAGMREAVRRGVVSGLIAAGAETQWAVGVAEAVTEESVQFDAAVAAIRFDGMPAPRLDRKHRPERSPIYGRIFHDVPDLVDHGQKNRQAIALQSTQSAEQGASRV